MRILKRALKEVYGFVRSKKGSHREMAPDFVMRKQGYRTGDKPGQSVLITSMKNKIPAKYAKRVAAIPGRATAKANLKWI
jgi:hypothetical protein